eukprot:3552180-Pleurochrysis_carterae.AAC.1
MVYAPKESPPTGRIYVIFRGVALYRNKVLLAGDHWGQEDIVLRSAKRLGAVASSYLHVYYIDEERIQAIAKGFPSALFQIKKFTMFEALKRHLLEELRQHRKRIHGKSKSMSTESIGGRWARARLLMQNPSYEDGGRSEI